MITLLLMTNGRKDCISRTVASVNNRLVGPITKVVINDDSNDHYYYNWLLDNIRFCNRDIISVEILRSNGLGFGGAIDNAWEYLYLTDKNPFVFHLEDDFTFNQRTDLIYLANCLYVNRHLAQLALKRQPCGADEIAIGGFMEKNPEDFIDCSAHGMNWIEQRLFFTTNPSLYKRQLIEVDWPVCAQSEGHFGFKLKEHGLPWGVKGEDVRFGYWGKRSDAPMVHHIGNTRTGFGY